MASPVLFHLSWQPHWFRSQDVNWPVSLKQSCRIRRKGALLSIPPPCYRIEKSFHTVHRLSCLKTAGFNVRNSRSTALCDVLSVKSLCLFFLVYNCSVRIICLGCRLFLHPFSFMFLHPDHLLFLFFLQLRLSVEASCPIVQGIVSSLSFGVSGTWETLLHRPARHFLLLRHHFYSG